MARILIVDDTWLMRAKLKEILEKAGHTIVAEAKNGREALDEYVRLRPDLVTMDIQMPILDGINAVKFIVQAYPDANIIMISAASDKNLIIESLNNGARYFLVKPIDSKRLMNAIDEALINAPESPLQKENAVNEKISSRESLTNEELVELLNVARMEGQMENTIKIASRMAAKRMNTMLISEITEMPIEEIMRITVKDNN